MSRDPKDRSAIRIEHYDGTKAVILNPLEVEHAADYLTIQCHEAAEAAGWWIDIETGEDVRTWPKKLLMLWISAKLMLIVSEASEANEGLRKSKMDDKLPHRPMVEVELADVVIRAFDLAGGMKYDIAGAIAEKLAFNSVRPDHKIANRASEGGKAI